PKYRLEFRKQLPDRHAEQLVAAVAAVPARRIVDVGHASVSANLHHHVRYAVRCEAHYLQGTGDVLVRRHVERRGYHVKNATLPVDDGLEGKIKHAHDASLDGCVNIEAAVHTSHCLHQARLHLAARAVT